jgi:hypothetical protein
MPNQSKIVWPALLITDAGDNLGIESLLCEFRVNSSTVDTFELFENADYNDLWVGRFECSVDVGDIVYYRIIATDSSLAGNNAVDPDTGWYSFEVVSYYSEPFEYAFIPYTLGTVTDGYGNQWHESEFRNNTSTGDRSFKFGDVDSSLTYSDRMDGTLMTPWLNLGHTSTLSFWHWIDAEYSGTWSDSAYDAGIVEIRITNLDTAWFQIYPEDGYTHGYRNSSGTGPFESGTECYSGNYTWSMEEFDLSDYEDSVQIRWRFGSDRAFEEEGWYIDDVYISTMYLDVDDTPDKPESLAIKALPNPFNSSCTFDHSSTVDRIEIVDVSGRIVENIIPNGSISVWSPEKGIESGIYIARFIDDESIETLRIVFMK